MNLICKRDEKLVILDGVEAFRDIDYIGDGKLCDMEIPIAQYFERMLLNTQLPMPGSDSSKVTFTIPADAQPGNTFHILLEVANQAETPLKAYQRYILTVA